jgi:hypothetical protein
MSTLNDAVELYKQASQKRIEERLNELVEKNAETEKFVRDAFETIGLTPSQITGESALFEFQDEEVLFFVRRWKYDAVGIQRQLEQCPRCEYALYSDEYELTLENIGWLLIDPQKKHHECWGLDVDPNPISKAVEKSTAEKLVELVDQLIDERISLSLSD